MQTDTDIPGLADLWRWQADIGYADSDLYVAIARGVSDDPDLIGLTIEAGTAHARFPNVLMAAVHELVLLGAAPELAEVYAGRSDAEVFPLFRAAALEHREALLPRLASQFTNTNEVGRSALVAPALAHVTADWVGEAAPPGEATQDDGGLDSRGSAEELVATHRPVSPQPWVLVEGGASAGINLCFDRFRLDYGASGALGDPAAAVRLACEDRTGTLPLPTTMPCPTVRVGLDRNPIDLTDVDERRWLLACSWPNSGRVERAAAAHEVVAADPPRLVRGDLVVDLPDLLAATRPDLPVVVMTTWVVAYLSPAQRVDLRASLAEASRTRPVTWLTGEGIGVVPLDDGGTVGDDGNLLGATRFVDGEVVDARWLARCHPHGRWIDWRGVDAPPGR